MILEEVSVTGMSIALIAMVLALMLYIWKQRPNKGD